MKISTTKTISFHMLNTGVKYRPYIHLEGPYKDFSLSITYNSLA